MNTDPRFTADLDPQDGCFVGCVTLIVLAVLSALFVLAVSGLAVIFLRLLLRLVNAA